MRKYEIKERVKGLGLNESIKIDHYYIIKTGEHPRTWSVKNTLCRECEMKYYTSLETLSSEIFYHCVDFNCPTQRDIHR
jgi:hypothetical protein